MRYLHLTVAWPSPGDEVYRIEGPDTEDQIEMALLNDLVRPVRLAFVGGEDARRYAELYRGKWIEGGPTAATDILRFWAPAT